MRRACREWSGAVGQGEDGRGAERIGPDWNAQERHGRAWSGKDQTGEERFFHIHTHERGWAKYGTDDQPERNDSHRSA
jgi:hypothetical protein